MKYTICVMHIRELRLWVALISVCELAGLSIDDRTSHSVHELYKFVRTQQSRWWRVGAARYMLIIMVNDVHNEARSERVH